jgi:hypothetical protein
MMFEDGYEETWFCCTCQDCKFEWEVPIADCVDIDEDGFRLNTPFSCPQCDRENLLIDRE